jgi:hypothetical protein
MHVNQGVDDHFILADWSTAEFFRRIARNEIRFQYAWIESATVDVYGHLVPGAGA